ncbi:Na+/H+ antiporter subunit E [Paragemmobacter straminiformis]|uniref:Na+/H+ antiporter subunit E n=1 Tax=Paragemmobacter straminiformis TaxID=2045119 RepID=A0A842IBV5_9RHOB|nr:Na+/H+ antiporter subunit E [Gemmobacter straminiformis]MBC2837056.1 Na+/H+ antiporter subunit E [Gemmobacter straminiformis]
MMRRLFPHPVLSLLLGLTWVLLVNHIGVGTLVMAAILGSAIPRLTHAYWPHQPRLNSLPLLLAYVALVVWDVILANIQVARIVLFMPRDRIRSAFIPVPITLKSPEAIALLAGTITMTPGTVTADMNGDGTVLLVHSLHAPDPDAIRDEILSRYESRLKRIFE